MAVGRIGRRVASSSRRAFSTLLRRPLADALRTHLQVFSPNEIQAEALKYGLAGDSMLCVAQTGSGKTLVALLPILERLLSGGRAECRTDILAPDALLLAPSNVLASQHASIARRLTEAMPNPPTIASDLSSPPSSCAPGGLLVVSTPNELLHHVRARTLDLSSTHTIAIDEVDAVLCSSSPFDPSISPDGAALLAAFDSAASAPMRTHASPPSPVQYILTTAVLTIAHEKALVQTFDSTTTGSADSTTTGSAHSTTTGSAHSTTTGSADSTTTGSAHSTTTGSADRTFRHVRQRALSGHGAGPLVPSLRQRFHYVPPAKKDAQLLKVHLPPSPAISTFLTPSHTFSHLRTAKKDAQLLKVLLTCTVDTWHATPSLGYVACLFSAPPMVPRGTPSSPSPTSPRVSRCNVSGAAIRGRGHVALRRCSPRLL